MVVKIQLVNSLLEIDTKGGRIIRLLLGNGEVLGTFDRIDGKQGNTHICTPNFGAEGKEMGLPFHGPSRNEEWTVNKQTENKIEIQYTMQETGTYPGGLQYVQTFVLSPQSFCHEIRVTNKTQKKVPVNVGIHNYWSTPGGWKGTKVNDSDVTDLIKTNGNIPLQTENKIIFPRQKEFQYALSGFADAVLWTGFAGDTFDRDYACIEPVRSAKKDFFGSKESLLSTNEHIIVRQSLTFIM